MNYRQATERDAVGIAALHADSWRLHYRGAYLDSYLDGDIDSDRRKVWADRLDPSRRDQYTVVAEHADGRDEILGFAHVVFDHDPKWGALLDNLHVRSDLKRIGIGRRLLSEAVLGLLDRRPRGPVHLWVLDQNDAAQCFYEALGGTRVETATRGPFPGGGTAIGHRYFWPDGSLLVVTEV